MFGLVVIEVMTPSGDLSNINEILFLVSFSMDPTLKYIYSEKATKYMNFIQDKYKFLSDGK